MAGALSATSVPHIHIFCRVTIVQRTLFWFRSASRPYPLVFDLLCCVWIGMNSNYTVGGVDFLQEGLHFSTGFRMQGHRLSMKENAHYRLFM